MRCNHFIAVVVCFCLVGASGALAQQQPQNNSALIVRAYNVSDLIRVSSDYPLDNRVGLSGNIFSTGRGGGGGNVFPQPEQAARGPNINPLIELISRTVEPESWSESTGRISSLSATLVVRQTGDIQNRVQQLLDELRKAGGPAQILTVRMTWVQSAPRELPDPKTEVTSEWINKQKVYYESQITCFSGQTVHLTSGQSRSVVTDLTPVIATGAVAFDPTVGSAMSGIMMQITPQIVPSNDSAIFDVQAVVSQSGVPDDAKPLTIQALVDGPTGKQNFGANIDRVTTVSQEFKTTARVPMKKKVIVGGMTLDPSSADHGGQQLYLVVEIEAGK